MKLRQPCCQFLEEPFGILAVLKTGQEVVRVAKVISSPPARSLEPPLKPHVERVVQVHIGEQWRKVSDLRHPFVTGPYQPVFQHSAFQHPYYQPQHALITDAVLQKLHLPLLIDVVIEALDVRLNDVAYLLLLNGAPKLVQGLVRRASRPIAVGTFYKVRFVYLLQYPRQRQRHQLVLKAQHAQRSLLARARFRNIDSLHWLRSITHPP